MTSFTTQILNSDSEGDEDFIPQDASSSDSASSSSDSDPDAPSTSAPKRKRVSKSGKPAKPRKRKSKKPAPDSMDVEPEIPYSETPAGRAELEAARKKKIEDLWAEMKLDDTKRKSAGSYKAAYAAAGTGDPKGGGTKRYEFAGQQFSVSQPAAGAPTAAPAPTDPVVTGPPRARKSRLMDIAVRYGVAHEAAKLTVLEKSKIDWKIHVEEVGDADRLTHNRKDGYLEKTAFLARTDERQAEVIQQLKRPTNRRR